MTQESEGEDKVRCAGNPNSSKLDASSTPVFASVSDKKITQSEPETEHPNRERYEESDSHDVGSPLPRQNHCAAPAPRGSEIAVVFIWRTEPVPEMRVVVTVAIAFTAWRGSSLRTKHDAEFPKRPQEIKTSRYKIDAQKCCRDFQRPPTT